jgi:integrase
VIAPLLRFLERHRAARRNPQSGWIFASANGSPLYADNLVRREIRPLLEKAKVEKFEEHGYRSTGEVENQRGTVRVATHGLGLARGI